MIVEQIMNKDVTSLLPTDSIQRAIEVMRTKKIRHIPIINDENEVVGIVSDRDIKEATPSILETHSNKDILKQPLQTIMKTEVITGHPLDFVEEVAAMFYEHHIGCMPIIQNQKLVGIITETDLLHTFVELTGAHQPGSQIEVRVPNKAGMLYEVAGIIRKRNANIHSVLVYPDREDEHYKILVFRVRTMNPVGIIEDLKINGYHVQWPYVPGITS
ncbi:MAG: CBS domain-containing protein [Bacillus sp. (in: Bacteria)]|nr:CBS domain-containing protein [Bacillus sp. (in: firmicutes)]